MARVTRELAERIAAVAELVLSEEDPDAPLRHLAELAAELIPARASAGSSSR